jgi:hypothetical protein
MTKYFQFDVALSFAGEDRPFVKKTARLLKQARIRVFYDEFEQVNLWGKNLYEHLHFVYRDAAQYVVIFISEHYARKAWTTHERRSAQERALAENAEYILPVRMDDSELPGLSGSVSYIRDVSPQRLAKLIQEKLGVEGSSDREFELKELRLTSWIAWVRDDLARQSEILDSLLKIIHDLPDAQHELEIEPLVALLRETASKLSSHAQSADDGTELFLADKLVAVVNGASTVLDEIDGHNRKTDFTDSQNEFVYGLHHVTVETDRYFRFIGRGIRDKMVGDKTDLSMFVAAMDSLSMKE